MTPVKVVVLNIHEQHHGTVRLFL